ncbi:hypothetical protein ACXYTP_06205 [Tsukamurella ocularis]|uniref:hypothetical protein n=1 Tax=Tsukamurella ocularis TaxID=1970234 RepID=UPI0039EFFC30
MEFEKARVAVITALCAAVVLCGVALWTVESRLVSVHPECAGTGTPRAAVAESAGDGPLLRRALDRVLGGLGCVASPQHRTLAK